MKGQKLGARFQMVVSYGEEPAKHSTVSLLRKKKTVTVLNQFKGTKPNVKVYRLGHNNGIKCS